MPDNARAGGIAVRPPGVLALGCCNPERQVQRGLHAGAAALPNCAATRDCYSWRVVIRIRVAT